jgi:hypothetical protein
MRRFRNLAHYEIDAFFPHSQAGEAVDMAYDTLKLLGAAMTASTFLAAITEAVRDYERNVLKQVTWQG